MSPTSVALGRSGAALRRLPIRLRITLLFAAALALVLASAGLFVYARLGRSLDLAIDDGLRARSASVAALLAQADTGLAESGQLDPERDGIAQVMDATGAVYDAVPGAARPLLTHAELARALSGRSLLLDRAQGVAGIDASTRLLAIPVTAQDSPLVVIVGASLEAKKESQHELAIALLLGGPLALLAASLVGYLVLGAALRPVEAMRQRAEAIGDDDLEARLPLADANDEIRRLGETLNAMLTRLQGALERERAFVSDASHELRTPLALLKTEIELALSGSQNPPELRAALLSAGEETDRLAQLADDLLVLARADNGRLPISPETIDVLSLLETIAARYERHAAAAGREISVDAPLKLGLRGDRSRLEQALGSLVENALRHGAGTVTLTGRRTQDSVELHVTDQGPGIPSAFLPHAFERFTRADEARGRGGSGLGLAIVQVIASAHHGEAHAATGDRADVWLAIPAVPRADDGTNRPRPTRPASRPDF